MDLELEGRHAVVTGGSKGIGLATAQLLAKEGCRVTLIARNRQALDEAAELIGPAATGVAVDIADSAKLADWFPKLDPVDILVNNAGAVPAGDIATLPEAHWRSAWDLKVWGYINLTRMALQQMSARNSGVIVNIIGVAGERPRAAMIASATGNAALMALTRAIGSTSIANGVRVVGINPGMIQTERMEAYLRDQAETRWGDADRWRDLLDPTYLPGTPAQIASLVAFLASDLAGNISGTIVRADGGSRDR
uniref:short-chain dehydrogenase/reductase n=1 Tax=uncultured Sphingomonas sp. TaxID=158754 RepID=UPI0035CBABBE